MTRTVGAILYENFELLDLYGPLEMFGSLPGHYSIRTVAQAAGPVASSQGPRTLADIDFEAALAAKPDMLLVPGGIGTITELENAAMLDFLRAASAGAEVTMSVCSGSALLARAGLLDGRRATSNKQFFDLARGQSAAVEWVEAARWVEDWPFVTSSGVSAGTDMALAVIAHQHGVDTAHAVAAYTEYQWHTDSHDDPFAVYLNKADPMMVPG